MIECGTIARFDQRPCPCKPPKGKISHQTSLFQTFSCYILSAKLLPSLHAQPASSECVSKDIWCMHTDKAKVRTACGLVARAQSPDNSTRLPSVSDVSDILITGTHEQIELLVQFVPKGRTMSKRYVWTRLRILPKTFVVEFIREETCAYHYQVPGTAPNMFMEKKASVLVILLVVPG